MLKKIFTAIPIVIMALILTPACAEQDDDAQAGVNTTQTEAAPAPVAEGETTVAPTADEQASVMNLPVDFSSDDNVEKSIEAVRQQAGETEARKLTNALGYILAYDLSLGRDKEKMYKKLNGRTPNEIIAKMKR